MNNRSENELALRMAGTRRRRGCLGCLGTLIGGLLFGIVVVLLVTAIVAPWGFYLGGQFHIIPYWQGWGTLHASSGNYPVFMRFGPSFRRGSRMYPSSRLRGIAYLCTPRGERFRMNLTGDMRFSLPVKTDGEHISFRLMNWPALTGGFVAQHRPFIDLVGYWRNPNLVLDDNSSLHRAFYADGSVIEKTPPNLPYKGEIVSVTITQGSYDQFEAACKTRP